MNPSLPVAGELEKLPLRAVVAYAARTARRLSSELRGVIPQETLEDALGLVDSVAKASRIDRLDKASIIQGAERVVAAYAAAPSAMKSPATFKLVFSVLHAAEAAMFALLAAEDPSDPPNWRKDAADEAEQAVRCIRALSGPAATSATDAALLDYNVLVREYGQHARLVVGDPICCFDHMPE